MISTDNLQDLRNLTHGKTVGFVPTMGAFHPGHLELIKRAKQSHEICVVSLFVNPTQFGPNEDFEKYPRDLDRDKALAEQSGCDVLFHPTAQTVYNDSHTTVNVDRVSLDFEGAIRPTHFAGVATVVAKLFGMVRPTTAFFGLKDLQQCAVIRTMVDDLFLPVLLEFVETVRESDGLAMSSRNAYLSPSERATAALLNQTLFGAANKIAQVQTEPIQVQATNIRETLKASQEALTIAGFRVDYFELVDPQKMMIIHEYQPNCRLVAAAKLGPVRLLDNVPISS